MILAEVTALTEGAAHHAEGIPLYAEVLGRIGKIPITNSTIVLWLIVLPLLIAFARAATKGIQASEARALGNATGLAPASAFQNFAEFVVEGLYDMLEGILGKHMVRRSFWFFATIFLVVLTCNWIGLLPIFGNVTYKVMGPEGRHTVPLFRAATADLNLPLAIAVVYFFLWLYWSLTEIGAFGMLKHIFAPKGGVTAEELGFGKVIGTIIIALIWVIFFAVGIIEVASIAFRQVSLPIRLYANVFAGENLMHAMGNFFGGWLITIPFYGLEILVGLVQALVFMLLTSVFTSLMTAHEEEGGH